MTKAKRIALGSAWLSVMGLVCVVGCSSSGGSLGVVADAAEAAHDSTDGHDVTDALDAWLAGDHDAAVEEFLAAAGTEGVDLRIRPILTEPEYLKLSEAEQIAIFNTMNERSKAWGGISRELERRADAYASSGNRAEHDRLRGAVYDVAKANARQGERMLYRMKADAILQKVSDPRQGAAPAR
jgi:NH3-dependent NAD+ synthetase